MPILASPERLDEASCGCPGIDKQPIPLCESNVPVSSIAQVEFDTRAEKDLWFTDAYCFDTGLGEGVSSWSALSESLSKTLRARHGRSAFPPVRSIPATPATTTTVWRSSNKGADRFPAMMWNGLSTSRAKVLITAFWTRRTRGAAPYRS